MSTKTKDANCDLVMFHFGPSTMVPSPSAFCLKLETYFRMANLQYRLEITRRGSSKGKLPFITHKGKEVADSTFIIEYLNKELNVDLNSHLSPAEKGIAQAFKRLSEENLYWVQVYQRWVVDSGTFTKTMPIQGFKKKIFPMFVALKIKPSVKANLNGHGIGRHSKEEIYKIGEKDMTSISDFLGEKPFLMGDEASEVDASIFGVLCQSVYGSPGSEQETFAKTLPNLVAYCDRMKEKYWPDWDCCCWLEPKDRPKPAAVEAKPQEVTEGQVNGDNADQGSAVDPPKENGTGDEEQAAVSDEQKPAEEQTEAQNGEGGDAPAPADEQQKVAEQSTEDS